MLAMALETNSPEHNHLIVAVRFFERFLKYLPRILRIPGEVFFKCPRHSSGSLEQTLAVGIVTRPKNDRPEGRLNISTRRASFDG